MFFFVKVKMHKFIVLCHYLVIIATLNNLSTRSEGLFVPPVAFCLAAQSYSTLEPPQPRALLTIHKFSINTVYNKTTQAFGKQIPDPLAEFPVQLQYVPIDAVAMN